jgi:hypothetical protein
MQLFVFSDAGRDYRAVEDQVGRQALPADMEEAVVIKAYRGTDEDNRAAICPGAPVVSVGTRPDSASPWNGACVSTLPLSLDRILGSVDFELFEQKLAKTIELLSEATSLLPYVHKSVNGRIRSFSQRRRLKK